jgi:lactate permease
MTIAAVALPFLVLLALSVWKRQPLWKSALASFFVATFFWLATGISVDRLLLPLMRALVVSSEIGLILLGAITFLELMQRSGRTSQLSASLALVSKGDYAVSALLIAWMFCSFLEGAAGFGAPAAIVAPLAVTLGFAPLLAAALPLIGDSVAVPFGAVGTPIRIGLSGLPTENVPLITAGLSLVVGLVAPLMIVRLVDGRWSWSGCRLACLASFMFTLPAFALSFFGPEFPTLGGSIIGMFGFLFLMNKRSKKYGDDSQRPLFHLAVAAAPYGLLCIVLLAGKFALNTSFALIPVGTENLRIAFFQPGIFLLLAASIFGFSTKNLSGRDFRLAISVGAQRVPAVWFAIFLMAVMAQYIVAFINSGSWSSIATQDPQVGAGILLAIASPVIGALGAFVTGSATVSCLLSGGILVTLANVFVVPTGLILSLALIGAGAGNMIALQNIAAVQATIGLIGKERDLLQKLWLPCLLAVSVTSFMGVLCVLLIRI